MSPDPELVAETRGWFLKAAHDLRAASLLLEAEPPLLDDVVFHCQQAAEKCLKGFLTWHSHAFRRTHNLEEIGELCLRVDGTLRELVDLAVPLTEYAWKFRYPGEPDQPTPEEAKEALALARRLYEAVLLRLPEEGRL